MDKKEMEKFILGNCAGVSLLKAKTNLQKHFKQVRAFKGNVHIFAFLDGKKRCVVKVWFSKTERRYVSIEIWLKRGSVVKS